MAAEHPESTHLVPRVQKHDSPLGSIVDGPSDL